MQKSISLFGVGPLGEFVYCITNRDENEYTIQGRIQDSVRGGGGKIKKIVSSI